jgi:hypothetical protein
LLAHGRWFSPRTPASSTTKTGRHDIAEILLKLTLNTIKQINLLYLRKTFNIMKILFRRMPGMTIIYICTEVYIYIFIYLFIYNFTICYNFFLFTIRYNIKKQSIFLLIAWEGFEEHLVWEALFKCICCGIVCDIFW